jgi:hypothetical protein
MNYILKNLLFFGVSSAIVKFAEEKSIDNKHNNLNLPDFRGILEVKHAVPGRFRLCIPFLKDNEELKAAFLNEVNKIELIKNVEINTLTASLIISYDTSQIEPQLLLAVIIKLLGLEEEITKEPTSLLKGELKNIKDSINMAIYNKSNGLLDGNSLIVLVLLLASAQKFYSGTGSKVGPTTCLMWALSYLD